MATITWDYGLTDIGEEVFTATPDPADFIVLEQNSTDVDYSHPIGVEPDALYWFGVRKRIGRSVSGWTVAAVNKQALPDDIALVAPADGAWLPESAFALVDATSGLGGSASASGSFSGTYAPAEAVDDVEGNNVDSWAANSTGASGGTPWWQIDLGAAKRILRSRIRLRGTGGSGTDIRLLSDDNSGIASATTHFSRTNLAQETWYQNDLIGDVSERYWRVAFDAVGDRAGISEIELLSADGALVWNESPDADDYRVQVTLGSDPSFAAPVIDVYVAALWYLPAGLNSPTEYIWRVAPHNETGDGNFTTARTLFVQDVLPLLTPTDLRAVDQARLGVGTTNKGSFTWTDTVLADSWDFQYSSDPTFAATIINATGLPAVPNYAPVWVPNPPTTGTRYWRVRPVNSGFAGNWSTTFTIDVSTDFRTYIEAQAEFKLGYRLTDDLALYQRTSNIFLLYGKELVRNGDMSSSTGWTLNAGWAIAGGLLTHTSGSGTNTATQPNIFINSRWYEISYTVSGRTTGSVRSGNSVGAVNSSNGALTEIIQVNNASIIFVPTNDFDGSIDNVSIREVNLQPSSEYPPITGRLNLATNWEFTLDYAWTKGTGWTIAGGKATHAAGTGSDLSQVAGVSAIVNTKSYDIQVMISGRTAGSLTPGVGGVTGTGITANGLSTVQTIVATGSGGFRLIADSAFDGSVEYVTLKPTNSLLVINGDGTSITGWTSAGGATGSATGGWIRVAGGTAGAGRVGQNCLIPGRRYFIMLDMRSQDGVGIPRLMNGAAILFTGTTSTSTQPVALIFFATSAELRLSNSVDAGTSEFDNILPIEINPTDVTVLGALPYQTLALPIDRGVYFDGTADVLTASGSPITSFMQLDEGEVMIVASYDAGVLTNGIGNYLFRSSTAEEVRIQNTTANNRIDFLAVFDSTVVTSTVNGFASTDMTGFNLSWDVAGNELIAYINGVQQGAPATGLVPSSARGQAPTIGASNSAGLNSHQGYIAYMGWFSEPLPAAVRTKANQLAEVI